MPAGERDLRANLRRPGNRRAMAGEVSQEVLGVVHGTLFSVGIEAGYRAVTGTALGTPERLPNG